jgi:hypothetical protein
MANAGASAEKAKYLDGDLRLEQLKIFSIIVVGLGLAFQVGHFAEHAVQFAVWLLGTSQWVASNFCGRGVPYMSEPVTRAVSAAGAYLFPSADVARQMMMGMETLHLVGNSVFLATIAGVFYFIPTKLVRYAFYIETAHLCEHVALTLSAYYVGTPIGVSTLFGQAPALWGTELAVGWRVSWHFAMNLLPMPLVMIAIMRHLAEKEITAEAAGRRIQTVLLTPQKNGSGPCVTPVRVRRQA